MDHEKINVCGECGVRRVSEFAALVHLPGCPVRAHHNYLSRKPADGADKDRGAAMAKAVAVWEVDDDKMDKSDFMWVGQAPLADAITVQSTEHGARAYVAVDALLRDETLRVAASAYDLNWMLEGHEPDMRDTRAALEAAVNTVAGNEHAT